MASESAASGTAGAVDLPAAPAVRLWSNLRPRVDRPARVLLAVPHGGAGPTSLWSMVQCLPPDWGVLALCLPGRERLITEPPGWDPARITADAAAEVRALLAPPVTTPAPGAAAAPALVLAGQCLGAWLAYALAADPWIRERCTGLFVFSQTPWDAPREHPPLPADPEQMWAQLAASGDIPAAVVVDAEYRAVLAPIIRADYVAVGRFPTAAEPLACPIVAVTGEHDPAAGRLRPDGWARYTPSLRIVRLPCGHLPMQDLPAAAAGIIAGQ
jgi:medium-chain acyl-[acyl-carrier-protein] hydrolase